MPTEISEQHIINVDSSTPNVRIQINIRDELVSTIAFTIREPANETSTEFLLPHDNTIEALTDLRAQIGDVIAETLKALSA